MKFLEMPVANSLIMKKIPGPEGFLVESHLSVWPYAPGSSLTFGKEMVA